MQASSTARWFEGNRHPRVLYGALRLSSARTNGSDLAKQGGMIVQTLLLMPNLPFKVHHAILAATSAYGRLPFLP
jgi:hypothetical protein